MTPEQKARQAAQRAESLCDPEVKRLGERAYYSREGW